MKTNPRLPELIAIFGILLSAFTLVAAEPATISSLAGQWQGTSRFTGISYAEATQKKIAPQTVELALHISADGTVTGRIGGAELQEGVLAENRGWLGRLLHLKTDYIIRGQLAGSIVPGSESGTHPINAPFNREATHLSGTVFIVYPVRYPYPILSLHLSQ